MIRQPIYIEDGVGIGQNLDTGPFVVLRERCVIGDNVRLWAHVVIDADAFIGNDVTIHCNSYISQKCGIRAGAFIGPGCVLLNDKYPVRRSPDLWEPVVVCEDAIIGGGVTILPGVVIGPGAAVGGGSVVTKDVPAGEVWYGNPARQRSEVAVWALRGVSLYTFCSKPTIWRYDDDEEE